MLTVMSGSTTVDQRPLFERGPQGMSVHPLAMELLSMKAADAARDRFDMEVYFHNVLATHFIRRSTWACKRGPISRIAGMTIT